MADDIGGNSCQFHGIFAESEFALLVLILQVQPIEDHY